MHTAYRRASWSSSAFRGFGNNLRSTNLFFALANLAYECYSHTFRTLNIKPHLVMEKPGSPVNGKSERANNRSQQTGHRFRAD